MKAKLRVGDTVVLLSGGPIMVVTEISDSAMVWVAWYHEGQIQRALLPEACVRK